MRENLPWTAHEAAWVAHLLRQRQWPHLRRILPTFVHPSEDLVLRVHFASLASQDQVDGADIRGDRQQSDLVDRHVATEVSLQKAALDSMCVRLAMLDAAEEEQACLYATSLTHKGGLAAEIAWRRDLAPTMEGGAILGIFVSYAVADAKLAVD